MRLPTKRKRGQSTIEFIFVFFAFIFFLLISYNAVVAFAVYQYLSYATFMTARAYQAARDTPDQQLVAAYRTMAIYVPGVVPDQQSTIFTFSRTRSLAKIINFNHPNAGNVLTPFSLQFEVPLVSLPMGQAMKRDFGRLQLTTSSLLGREPTKAECHTFFTRFFSDMNGSGPATADDMEDNGC